MEIVNLLGIALLIALTAFFVAAEFAIVKMRSSRVDQLVAEGKPGALAVERVTTHLDAYLSACQLGITITALGLGWIGEPTVEKLLHPLFEHFELASSVASILSFVIAFSIVTFLHVVVGELAPKTVAIQKAEEVTLALAVPLIWFYRIMYPFIWILNGSARFITGLFGLKMASENDDVHTEEEWRLLLSESYKSGEINQNELKYVNNIFEFDERLAKEIMVPRTEMVSLSIDDTLEDVLAVIKEEKYTRYPVIDGDKDNVIGMVNFKEILSVAVKGKPLSKVEPLRQFVKPVIRVFENMLIHNLLVKMQKERTHMAVLIDEYGGTSGLVTVEDILEEIVGEIRDEYDTDEIAEVRKVKDGHYIFSAKVLIGEVNVLLGTDLNDEDVDTLGGWFLTEKIDTALHDILERDDWVFTITEMEDHHILYIEAKKRP
ncbi:hemolysin family protein [Domibacillus sp. A3M-37]|uniref:hemolysin family protein n=1 Tax=Domibacillus TaxID=1433999 RepID=UPI000618273A|nr:MULTISPECIES: hemolysin family protein [Domibacillus]MCP3761790.1 hemolysin family protein [Domibacillus sp. A3M-37]